MRHLVSATFRAMTFGLTVEDYEHWTAEHLQACEAAGASSYDGWVFEQLYDVMFAAGNAFIAAHPDLFRTDGLT